MKNAIVFLLMLNDKYVNGALITSYIHRLWLKKINLEKEVEIVIMVDKIINKKYKKVLSIFFDKIYEINLTYFPYNEQYKFYEKKYSKWLSYSLNKWQCLKLDMYSKILFMDIDILIIKPEFYKIFQLKPPYTVNNHNVKYSKYKNTHVNISYNKFIKNNGKGVNGGIVLLEPSSDIYNKYIKFAHKIYSNGIYSTRSVAPDETSLYYFYYYILKNKFKMLNEQFLVIPWDKKNNIDYYAYNYLSFIKPWLKPKIIMWDEEFLWSDALSIIIQKNKKIILLMLRDYVYCFFIYIKQWNEFSEKDKPFNNKNLKKFKEDFCNKLNLEDYSELYKFVNEPIFNFKNNKMKNILMSLIEKKKINFIGDSHLIPFKSHMLKSFYKNPIKETINTYVSAGTTIYSLLKKNSKTQSFKHINYIIKKSSKNDVFIFCVGFNDTHVLYYLKLLENIDEYYYKKYAKIILDRFKKAIKYYNDNKVQNIIVILPFINPVYKNYDDFYNNIKYFLKQIDVNIDDKIFNIYFKTYYKLFICLNNLLKQFCYLRNIPVININEILIKLNKYNGIVSGAFDYDRKIDHHYKYELIFYLLTKQLQKINILSNIKTKYMKNVLVTYLRKQNNNNNCINKILKILK